MPSRTDMQKSKHPESAVSDRKDYNCTYIFKRDKTLTSDSLVSVIHVKLNDCFQLLLNESRI